MKSEIPLLSATGLLSAYKGLKLGSTAWRLEYFVSLLSAYKGLKQILATDRSGGKTLSLLSAYKGLKRSAKTSSGNSDKAFIKCL